jgi:hypothetical protein
MSDVFEPNENTFNRTPLQQLGDLLGMTLFLLGTLSLTTVLSATVPPWAAIGMLVGGLLVAAMFDDVLFILMLVAFVAALAWIYVRLRSLKQWVIAR